MNADPASPDDAVAEERLDGGAPFLPRVELAVVLPASRMRSPIMEHRSFKPVPVDEDRPMVLLPPLRAFVGPTRFAVLVAVPLLLLATWQLALVGGIGASVAREVRRRMERLPFTLADGFLPYRPDPDWPQGVQEEDDVRWNWRAAGSGTASR